MKCDLGVGGHLDGRKRQSVPRHHSTLLCNHLLLTIFAYYVYIYLSIHLARK